MSWGMRQWTEREIREIVREELLAAKIGRWYDEAMECRARQFDERMAKDAKPKTDLERAAEIADKEMQRDLLTTPEFVTGYYAASKTIAGRIRALMKESQ